MAQRIPIQLHVANALQWLGTLYRSPADALKEHVSNAIDEHLKARSTGHALARCRVVFRLDRRAVAVEYPYAMSRQEFEAALRRVADSAKRTAGAQTIGRLGIGIFSFQQVGRKCTFYTRKTRLADTLRVVLKEGSDEASVETAPARVWRELSILPREYCNIERTPGRSFSVTLGAPPHERLYELPVHPGGTNPRADSPTARKHRRGGAR